jgi:hypothetical protein
MWKHRQLRCYKDCDGCMKTARVAIAQRCRSNDDVEHYKPNTVLIRRALELSWV